MSADAVLAAARGLAVGLLERAATVGDVPRRVVELAGELLDATESPQASDGPSPCQKLGSARR